jgi:uncharacterized membrane protein
MEKNRLEAFSDGVFAIVITLMVFEIKIPHVDTLQLNSALVRVLPKILAFVLSFIIIGVYWVAHHNMLFFIKSVDRTALWLNNLVLLTVALIPFPTALLGDYPYVATPAILYGTLLSLVNFSGLLFWLHCTKNNRLTLPNFNPKFRKKVIIVHSSPIFFYLLAIFVTEFSVVTAYFIYFAVPVFFIIPNKILQKALSKPYLN